MLSTQMQQNLCRHKLDKSTNKEYLFCNFGAIGVVAVAIVALALLPVFAVSGAVGADPPLPEVIQPALVLATLTKEVVQ